MLLTLAALASSAVLAQDAAEHRYGNWLVRCPDDSSGRCFLSQTVLMQGSGQRMFEVGIGFLADGSTPTMVLTAPLGIYLPYGLRLQVDSTEPRRVLIERCNSDGCHTEIALSPTFLRQLKRGMSMFVVFGDAAGQRFRFPVSLQGLTAGMKRLQAGG